MSRSNNTELQNPANRFFEWDGAAGAVRYYDKEAQTNVQVKLPVRFLVLDRVSQVTGGIDQGGGYIGFWSNTVRNTKVQPFTVRSKQGVVTQGLYEHIKGHPGVKYMQGLYIAYKGDDASFQIGYLKIKGAALTAWIEFTKIHRNIYQGVFAIVGNEEQKKGATTYYSPVYEFSATVPEAAENAAIELDKQLQEYLTEYFSQKGIEEVEQEYSETPQFAAAVGSHTGPEAPYMPPSDYEPGDAYEGDWK